MKQYRRYFIIGSILWSLFILILTTLPASELPNVQLKGLDKAVHFSLFLVFGFLVSGSVTKENSNRFYLISVLVTVWYGITMEWLQRYIPGRSVDYYDMIFNFLGALCGLIIFHFLEKKMGK